MSTMQALSRGGIDWRLIDLDLLLTSPLDEQGSFDVLLHKLSEEVFHEAHLQLRAEGDIKVSRLQGLLEYSQAHGVPLIDSPDAVARVVNRGTTCELLASIDGTSLGPTCLLKAPQFILAANGVNDTSAHEIERLLELKKLPLSPLICKPVLACGPGFSHNLTLLLGRPCSLQLGSSTEPCVVQAFVDHDSQLIKVYVIGEEVH